jgi:hypothetical protein
MRKQQKNPDKQSQQHEQQELPGYPPYPPEDDIVRNANRVEGNFGDEEGDPRRDATPLSGAEREKQPETDPQPEARESEFEVTQEDLEALGPVDLSMDLGEDEQLKQRTHPVDFAAENLDVPGTSDDDDREDIGSEDEENNSYSLGGDGHTDLEEGRQ